jgi:hypothetical protein
MKIMRLMNYVHGLFEYPSQVCSSDSSEYGLRVIRGGSRETWASLPKPISSRDYRRVLSCWDLQVG